MSFIKIETKQKAMAFVMFTGSPLIVDILGR